jgi:hypothetical protein
MKRKKMLKIQLLLFCLYLFSPSYAQVTIGINEEPAEGALLQLKDIANAASGDKNAEKGLLMPRISLISHTTLEPLVRNASKKEEKECTGLIVYNLTENDYLKKGIVVWNGSEWKNIKNNERTKSVDVEVMKRLYKSQKPVMSNSVSSGSMEISMQEGIPIKHYAYPMFRIINSYKPSGKEERKYLYQITQYWEGIGYSNDVEIRTFKTNDYSTYQDFIGSTMSTLERNEVWMYDETGDTVFHIHFFVMGQNTADAIKIYAILAEEF